MRVYFSLFILCSIIFFTSCNLNTTQLQDFARPQILEKELMVEVDATGYELEPLYPNGKYAKYTYDGYTWGLIYDGKTIVQSIYSDIKLVGDYACITKKETVTKKSRNGDEYETDENWMVVINKDKKVIVPFTKDLSTDDISLVKINGKLYVVVSSGWDAICYDTTTGQKYEPKSTDDVEHVSSDENNSDENEDYNPYYQEEESDEPVADADTIVRSEWD